MRRSTRPVRPLLIELEPRLLLNASLPPPPGPPPIPTITDQQWLNFYGLNDVPVKTPDGGTVAATGQGQTIVIISIYRDASYLDSTNTNWLSSGLAVYSQEMGLNTNFSFQMVGEYGDPNFGDLPTPGNQQTSREFDLDTQAIHTIAPQANIIDIVANSGSTADRLACFQTALQYHPAVISMSFSWTEAPFTTYQQWAFQGGQGTTIVESAGDSGAGMQYMGGNPQSPSNLQYQPIAAQSPDTVMVGGSKLTLSGNSFNVTAWGDGPLSYVDHNKRVSGQPAGEGGGSRGGYSLYEPQPAYQAQSSYVQQNVPLFPTAAQGMRLGPDLAMESKPGIELLTYYNDPNSGQSAYQWTTDTSNAADPIGGTSLSAPTFAAAMALVAQARAAAHEPPLSSIDTLNFLYQAPRADFLDITHGNSGYPALPGFDLASGLGSPNPGLWQYLSSASYSTTAKLTPGTSTALVGQPTMLTATVTAPLATPAGTVTFLDNGRPIGTATLNASGQAMLSFTPSTVGMQDLSVVYDAHGLFSGSMGAAPPMQVVAMPTVTTLTIGRPHRRGPLTLTATVASGNLTPDGEVIFSIGSRVLGTAMVQPDGRATLTRHFPRLERFRLSASFAGQVPFADSTTSPLRVMIRQGHVRVIPWSPAQSLIRQGETAHKALRDVPGPVAALPTHRTTHPAVAENRAPR